MRNLLKGLFNIILIIRDFIFKMFYNAKLCYLASVKGWFNKFLIAWANKKRLTCQSTVKIPKINFSYFLIDEINFRNSLTRIAKAKYSIGWEY